MYEKIFGEAFVTSVGPEKLEDTRQRFHESVHPRNTVEVRISPCP
jgi:hypothetical protein